MHSKFESEALRYIPSSIKYDEVARLFPDMDLSELCLEDNVRSTSTIGADMGHSFDNALWNPRMADTTNNSNGANEPLSAESVPGAGAHTTNSARANRILHEVTARQQARAFAPMQHS